MAYSPAKTATKAAAPVLSILVVGVIIDYVANKTGIQFPDDMPYKISAGIYGVFVGLINWLKNRTR